MQHGEVPINMSAGVSVAEKCPIIIFSFCLQHNPSQIPPQTSPKMEHTGSRMILPLLVILGRFFSLDDHQQAMGLLRREAGRVRAQLSLSRNFCSIWSNSNRALGFPLSCHAKNVNILPFPPPSSAFLRKGSLNYPFPTKFSQLILFRLSHLVTSPFSNASALLSSPAH